MLELYKWIGNEYKKEKLKIKFSLFSFPAESEGFEPPEV